MAAQAIELSPVFAIGMAVRADVAPVDPATIRAMVLWTEVAGGVDLTDLPPSIFWDLSKN